MNYILKTSFLLLLTMAIVWFAGLCWFIHIIPNKVGDTVTQTDGIVVLTGGSERLNTALRLINENKAKKLLISGAGGGITLENLKTLEHLSAEQIDPVADRITLGYLAQNTYGNAKEAAIWAELEGYHSLRLVTANYHIPRTMVEFSHALPEVTLIPHPVFPTNVKVEQWWRFPGSARFIIIEYHKYIGSVIRHSFIG